LRLIALYARLRAERDAHFDAAAFAGTYAAMAAQRATKLLGIFTRLDRRDGKPQYLQLLPLVERRLARNLAHPLLRPLRGWFEACLPRALGQGGSASLEP
jgi:aminoglycoside/choline kinase family phosphotransferase